MSAHLSSRLNEVSPLQYQHTLLADMELAYKPSRAMELRLRATNLLDHRDYSITYALGANTHSYRVPLRGRELIGSISFGF